jgi:hypothetical protein
VEHLITSTTLAFFLILLGVLFFCFFFLFVS